MMTKVNRLRTDVLMKDMSPLQEELMDFYATQPSHLGFLLSISAKEFKEAYDKIHDEEDNYLAVESALMVFLSKKSDYFYDKEMLDMIDTIHANYNLISLVRKGLVRYKTADDDGSWTFIRLDSEVKGHKLYGEEE